MKPSLVLMFIGWSFTKFMFPVQLRKMTAKVNNVLCLTHIKKRSFQKPLGRLHCDIEVMFINDFKILVLIGKSKMVLWCVNLKQSNFHHFNFLYQSFLSLSICLSKYVFFFSFNVYDDVCLLIWFCIQNSSYNQFL